MQLVILDKHEENCSSNQLESIGMNALLDRSIEADMPFAVVSTDECSAVRPLLSRKSNSQMAKLGVEIKIQNDAFHKIRNNRKARQVKFGDQKIMSGRVTSKLENIK